MADLVPVDHDPFARPITFTASNFFSDLYDTWKRGSDQYAQQMNVVGADTLSLKNLPQTWQSEPGIDTVLGFGPGDIGMLGAIKPSGSGMNILNKIASDTTQKGVVSRISSLAPKTFEDYIVQRSRGMSRQELIDSDLVWAKARELSDKTGEPFSRAYERVIKIAFDTKGEPGLTAEEIAKTMSDWARVQKHWLTPIDHDPFAGSK